MNQLTIHAVTLLIFLSMSPLTYAAGVWSTLQKVNPAGGCGTMMLLTDGTVIVQGPGETNSWNKLTPDSAGNYNNGTWSSIASMSVQRLYFGSNVLPSGKVFVLGGEYSSDGGFSRTGEMYDPVANKWTAIAPFPQSMFGDDPTVLLPNGKILAGYLAGAQTYLYDPTANTWTQTGTKLRSDASDEETWVLMADGSVLSYDVFGSPATGTGHAQRYVPSSGSWVDAGSVPVPLTGNAFGSELGPATLLPDGRFFQVGANNNTVLYTPSTNKWVQGPSLPANMGSDDAPGAMLPDGHFIFAADTSSPAIFTPPAKLFDFDYTTNTLSAVTMPAALTSFLSGPAYIYRMLVLPNGHMLLCSANSGTVWEYAPSGTPLDAWRPTIASITSLSSGAYQITGTQLTGISEGASYGDDCEMSTNYPIVRLTNSLGVVSYAKTTNWTPGVATGSKLTTVQFTPPAKYVPGSYQVAVIANGIASLPRTYQLGYLSSNVTALYSGGTLTLTGDTNANALTVSVSSGVVKVEGANNTKINGTTTYSSVFSGKLAIIANLDDGDDAISFVGMDSSTTNLKLGAGNDRAVFTLCNIATLIIDGGAGNGDVYLTTSSKIGNTTATNFP